VAPERQSAVCPSLTDPGNPGDAHSCGIFVPCYPLYRRLDAARTLRGSLLSRPVCQGWTRPDSRAAEITAFMSNTANGAWGRGLALQAEQRAVHVLPGELKPQPGFRPAIHSLSVCSITRACSDRPRSRPWSASSARGNWPPRHHGFPKTGRRCVLRKATRSGVGLIACLSSRPTASANPSGSAHGYNSRRRSRTVPRRIRTRSGKTGV